MEPCASMALGAAAQAVAQIFLACGASEEAVCEGAKVEAGAAGDDGKLIVIGDIAKDGAGLTAVVSGSERLVGVGDVDEVMRDACALFGRGFGGAKVHAAINGNGIAAGYFTVETFSQGERERRFAATGGAEDQDRERVSLIQSG